MDRRLKIFVASLCLLASLNGGMQKTIEYVVENTITLVIPSAQAQIGAGPWAHGFGKEATGGAGGYIIYVTNTNNSGSGSLREALLASGARTIIFRVSGTITWTSAFTVNNGNFTIAGESAPGQGIQIICATGAYAQIQASNVIMRHIRSRGASSTSQAPFRFYANGEYENVIIDHCSFSWANPDEMSLVFEAGGTGDIPQYSNITVSNCIFGEANRGILQYKGHNNVSYYRNYFYGIYQRSPEMNRPNYQNANTLSFEVINHLYHNNFHWPVESQYGGRITVIGSKRTGVPGAANASATGLLEMNAGAAPSDGTEANSWIYQTDNQNDIGAIYDSGTTGYLEGTPYDTSDITGDLILPVADIDDMLPNLGAFWWDRDSHDQRFIDYYVNQNGSQGTYSGTPDTLDSGTAYTDTDGDGMSNTWETANGTNPSVADNNGFTLSADYTNLQMFLSYMAQDETTPSPEPEPETSITPTVFRIGTSNSPFFYLGATKYRL